MARSTRLIGFGMLLLLASTVRADDWPQWGGPRRDGVWRETGVLEAFPADGLTFRWRVEIGDGYTGPAVADGRVYVTDRQASDDTERVICLDEKTGKELWTHPYKSIYRQIDRNRGPRATPTVHDGKVYSIGTMGDLFCLDAVTGKVLWQKNFIADFGTKVPIWGMSAPALVDGRKLICLVGGADNAVVVALDRLTGKELWRSVTAEEPGYCPPTIIEAGGTRQLLIWHPQALVSLDPETGKVFWEHPFAVKAGLAITPPVIENDMLFFSAFYNGPVMLRLAKDRPAKSLLWKGKSDSEKPNKTDGLHALMCTPLLRDGHIYGVGSYGHLRCLDAKTGRRLWSTLDYTGEGRWWNAFLTPNGDRTFITNEQGELIIARLTPKGHELIDRTKLIEPTGAEHGRKIVWSPPAYANRHIFARNDNQIVCASLAAIAKKGVRKIFRSRGKSS
jgi:outer membrane protein assembly factor BamB